MKIILTFTVILVLAACAGRAPASPIQQEQQIAEAQDTQAVLYMLIQGEAWAAANRPSNSVHFDFATQQQLRSNYDQRTGNDTSDIPAVLEEYSSQYSGQTIMITGVVQYEVRTLQTSNNQLLYYVDLRRIDGVGAIVTFHPNQTNRVSQIRAGNVITVTGICANFIEGPSRNPIKVSLFDCEIRNVLSP